MALEAVCYNYCKDYNSLSSPWSYDYGNNSIPWDEQQQHQFVNSSYSSPDGNNHCSVELPYNDVSGSGEAPPAATTVGAGGGSGVGKRKRRRRSSKNKEQVEQQRMTHIAVERNRRKQMNDYLAVIRSLMPPSYSQRGDQASIVGGAINYVKELEQVLQSLEAHKRSKLYMDSISSSHGNSTTTNRDNDDDEEEEARLFGDFFNYPQYSSSNQAIRSSNCNNNEIEVTMVDGHANVKVLAKKQNKQLLKLLAAFHALSLSVLHLTLTTLHPFVLYSFNLKVEEGSRLNSVDDIAAATNHILAQIQEEVASLPQ